MNESRRDDPAGLSDSIPWGDPADLVDDGDASPPAPIDNLVLEIVPLSETLRYEPPSAPAYIARPRSRPPRRVGPSFASRRLVGLPFVAIVALLVIRCALTALGASRDPAFGAALYEVTDVLMRPFADLVPASTLPSGFVIEWSVAVAIGVYLLAHAGVTRLAELAR